MKNITAITVSVNYSDFLVHTIEANKELFDRWIIITDFADQKTLRLCEENGIECLQTNAFYEADAPFNKYAGINKALEWVEEDDWILFLDSDIVLQKDFRRILASLELAEDCIYGIDRLDCEGYERWEQYKASAGVLKDYWLLHSAGLPLGARLVHLYGVAGENGKFGGYNPLGYFQLVHRSQFRRYPDESGTADHCDLVFAKQWARNKRHLIPEMFAVHLESVGAKKSVNWKGRKSVPFEKFVEVIEAEIEKAVEEVEAFIEHIFTDGVPPGQPY